MGRAILGLGVVGVIALSALPARAERGMQGRDATFIKTKRCQVTSVPPGWNYPDESWVTACVAMGIADYCGTGGSNTLWGTPVVIYDVDHRDDTGGADPRTPVTGGGEVVIDGNPDSPRFFFEAGWQPFNAKGKDGGQALCLSKKRWSTLPLNGPCPVLLPDPRDPANKQNPRARFCEDLAGAGVKVDVGALEANDPTALATLRGWGALIFNKSAFLDAGLHFWSDGTRFLSTTDGTDLGPESGSEAPSFAGGEYQAVRSARTGDSLLGVTLSDGLVWLLPYLGAITPGDEPSNLTVLVRRRLAHLITYKLASGAFLTTTHASFAGLFAAVEAHSEGWIFESRAEALDVLADPAHPDGLPPEFGGTPAGVQALVRWEKCTSGPLRLCALENVQFATLPAPRTPGAGWTAVAREGWVLRAPAP